jgi:hypothetical protein
LYALISAGHGGFLSLYARYLYTCLMSYIDV